jgi:hypothetical protein
MATIATAGALAGFGVVTGVASSAAHLGLSLTGRLLFTAAEATASSAISLAAKYVNDEKTNDVLTELDVEAKLRVVRALLTNLRRRHARQVEEHALHSDDDDDDDDDENEHEPHNDDSTEHAIDHKDGDESGLDYVDVGFGRLADGGLYDPVGVCVQTVGEIMDLISATLCLLHQEVEYHNTRRWFASWRSPKVEEHLVQLRRQCTLLDKRVDMLVKCVSVSGN